MHFRQRVQVCQSAHDGLNCGKQSTAQFHFITESPFTLNLTYQGKGNRYVHESSVSCSAVTLFQLIPQHKQTSLKISKFRPGLFWSFSLIFQNVGASKVQTTFFFFHLLFACFFFSRRRKEGVRRRRSRERKRKRMRKKEGALGEAQRKFWKK